MCKSYNTTLVKVTYLLCLSISIIASPASSQSSMLDVTFGNGGKVVTAINDTSTANDIAIQPDGKIIVGGSSIIGGRESFTLVRYNIDGSLDNTFGSGGKVITKLGSISRIYSIAIQQDGKIVAGGPSNYSTGGGFTVIRYKIDGSIDSLFGNNGMASAIMSNGLGELKKVLIKADGKILTAGRVVLFTFEEMPVIVQYNTNGSLDSSFGVNGKFGGYVDDVGRITDMALAKDGKIFAAGILNNSGYVGDFALLRFLENGRLDNSFGANGVVKTDFYNSTDEANSIAIQANGAIVLAGYVGGKFALARYVANGSLDTSFGSGGKVVTSIYNMTAIATDLIVEPGGKLIVSGYTYKIPENFVVTRYYTNGNLDSTFGNNGIDTTDFAGFRDQAFASALQADGKIVLAGQAGSSNNKYSIALARYSMSVLPLKLLSFTAIKEGKNNLLQWQTAQEINLDRFEIERSSNGRDYSSIGKVNSGLSNYTFTDNTALSGVNYYRVKMIDKDGKFEYSLVRTLINSGSFYVSIYPLPAKGRLNMQIESSKTEKAEIFVTDIGGKTLITNFITLAAGVNNTFINVQALSKGAYFLKIVTSETTETRKIILE